MDDKIKIAGLIVLVVAAVGLSVYFFLFPSSSFVTGAPVDQGTFKDIFTKSSNVYILSDVRGVTDSNISRNVLQCQVDFASSSGMGGKNTSYYSIGEQGCFSSDGKHPDSFCFSQPADGVMIYVHSGNTTSFYSNGMTVGVDNAYKFGTCGIKRTG